jgi:hypothetical protein
MSDLVRVLVRTVERQDGVATVEQYEFVDCTPEQAAAYAAGRADWCEATAQSDPWPKRLWRRLTGDA